MEPGWKHFFNSFVLNAPFLYPLETSFVEKGGIGNEWVKDTKRVSKTRDNWVH